ncbi:hypothetical protein O7623_12380 [Solwaraspora sp. WMMD791]|uniref:hypothetical protein n=1 Tax=Solwaraspora sp. WMMD791 TaxID=3016086 RepID=UPI00249BFD9D|nr:hypothetical protein [Solwaraspora sp. WMMD791]WFE29922.1 hypothetical protein O7623_12380 [Solwaraspora sp. WMMD791]
MTEQAIPDVDRDARTDDQAMPRAVRAARAHAEATAQTARYLDRTGALPDPADVAEYANLLAREELTRDERADALRLAGLDVPSLDADEG